MFITIFCLGFDIGFGFPTRAVLETNGYSTTEVNGVKFTTGQGEVND